MLQPEIKNLAIRIQNDLINGTVTLPPIHYKTIIDGNSGKERVIGVQSMIHQIYDYIAVHGLMELFKKKITINQCASIPNRGQHYGKNLIVKWRKYDNKGTRYCIQADISKCYPSINHVILKKKLSRDVKNDKLLWLTFRLIDMFDEGLSIGSYLSQFLCNYFLSYASHFINERLFIMKKSRGKDIRINLVKHSLFYMDDILLFGANKKHLHQAISLLIDYLNEELDLTIKPSWRAFKTDYIDKNGKRIGSFIDSMGFRIYCDHVTMRQKIFLRVKRRYMRMRKKLKKRLKITVREASGNLSYFGWVKNTDSFKFKQKYIMKYNLLKILKRIVSLDSKYKATLKIV